MTQQWAYKFPSGGLFDPNPQNWRDMRAYERYGRLYDLLQKYQSRYYILTLSPLPPEAREELGEIGFTIDLHPRDTEIRPTAWISYCYKPGETN